MEDKDILIFLVAATMAATTFIREGGDEVSIEDAEYRHTGTVPTAV